MVVPIAVRVRRRLRRLPAPSMAPCLRAARPARRACRRSSSPASARFPTSPRRTTGTGATSPSTSGSPRAAAGMRVADLACGEGYGSDVLARTGRRGRRRRREPRGPRARAAALPRAEPALRARPGRGVRRARATRSSSCRRSSTSTSRARCSRAIAAAAPLAYISTPNRLTLAPEGAEKSDNPWHLREYTAAEYRELLEPHFARVEILGLFHARKLRVARARAARRLGPRPQGAAITKPFYDRFTPAIAASDFALAPSRGELDGRSTSSRSASA